MLGGALSRESTLFAIVIVGAGPGGSGPLLYCAQQGRLGVLLDQGVAVVDSGHHMVSGTIGRYQLNSDSLGTSFLECLDSRHARNELGIEGDGTEAIRLEEYRYRHAPLRLISEYLARIGSSLKSTIDTHPASRFFPGARAHALHLLRDGGVEVHARRLPVKRSANASDGLKIRARTCILALGGAQSYEWIADERIGCSSLRISDLHRAKIALTDEVFDSHGFEALVEKLKPVPDPRVVILGGSHGAFSVAWAFLNRSGLPFGEKSITLMHRDRVRVFYPSEEEAASEGYEDFDEDDVCPLTDRIHRLGGLRGDGRDLWRRQAGYIPGESEPRLHVVDLRDDRTARRLLDEADLIVPAFGYRAKTLPVYDVSGKRIELAGDAGRALVGRDCRVKRADGTSLPNIFGIGMASGFLPSGGEFGGEESFSGQSNGVWLYQNTTGALVLRGIEEELARTPVSAE